MSLEKLDELLWMLGFKRLGCFTIQNKIVRITYLCGSKELNFTAEDAAKFSLESLRKL